MKIIFIISDITIYAWELSRDDSSVDPSILAPATSKDAIKFEEPVFSSSSSLVSEYVFSEY